MFVRGLTADVSAGGTTVLDVPKGPSITLPAHTVSGAGKVKVQPVTSGGLSGWKIQLQGGSKLVGTVKLSFPIDTSDGGMPILVGYTEHEGDQLRLVPGRVDGDQYVISTNHFSFWTDNVLEPIKEKLVEWASETFSGVINPTVPTCSGWDDLEAAGYSYSASATRLINSCVGAENGKPQIRISSRLGAPQIVETTPGLTPVKSKTTLDNVLPKLFAETQVTKRKGDTMTFLSPKETMVLNGAAGTQVGVNVSPSGVGYLASVMVLAAKLVAQLSGFAGAGKTAENLMTSLDAESCMGPIIENTVGKNVTSVKELTSFAVGLVRPVFDCAATLMKDEFKGFLASEIIGAFEWLALAAQSAASGAVGALASILEPNGATIEISAPASPTGGSNQAFTANGLTWTPFGGATATPSSDGATDVAFSDTFWGGIAAPVPSGTCDYTFTADVKLNSGDGYGVGVRASVNDGTPSANTIQYDVGAGGYKDTTLPGGSETGDIHNVTLDNNWHTLVVTASGNTYTSSVDGKQIFTGQTTADCGGVILRLWRSDLELRDATVTPQ